MSAQTYKPEKKPHRQEQVVDPDYEQGADPDYDDAPQASYDEAGDPDYDEAAQVDPGDDYPDPDALEGSQEYQPRKQK